MAISAQIRPLRLAPFRIGPWYSERVWGCRDLRPWFDRVVADGVPIGEAWAHGDQCVVATGAHAGQTLGALFAESPERLLGSSAPSLEAGGPSASPLLIKVIFAKENSASRCIRTTRWRKSMAIHAARRSAGTC